MKISFYLITTFLIILGCDPSTTLGNKQKQEHEQSTPDNVTDSILNQSRWSTNPNNLLTLSDAEKILGEQSSLTDSSSTIKEDVLTYLCAYTANSKDQKTGKTGAIYFLFEQYDEISSAQKKYSSIKVANENHEGIKIINDIGDEAYFHTDGQNFYFIMVRKDEKVFNMKVNKITSKTSLDEFYLIAKKITADL